MLNRYENYFQYSILVILHLFYPVKAVLNTLTTDFAAYILVLQEILK